MIILVSFIEASMLVAAVLLSIWIGRWIRITAPALDKRSVKIVLTIVFLILSSMIPAAYFMHAGFFQKWFRRIGYFWMVTEACLFIGMLITLIIANRLAASKGVTRKTVMQGGYRKVSTGIVVVLTAVFVIYGCWNASSNTQVTSYDVEVDEDMGSLDELKVVLVADQHFGYNAGCALAEKMAEKINSLDADIVIFGGDTFDNQYDAVDDPERLAEIIAGIKSTYGTYSCFGNHDVEDNLLFGFSLNKDNLLTDPRYEVFFDKAGINGLADETILIDDSFYLTGRRDLQHSGNESGTRLAPSELTAELDKDRLILCIDHEPPKNKKAAAELEASGTDIVLSGHTHNGQIAPVNFVLKFVGFNAYGYKTLGGLQSFTTSGIGAFGPYMRIGTKSEIMLINIHPAAG